MINEEENKKSAKIAEKVDKKSKKIIKLKQMTRKKINRREKKDKKRILSCNKKLLKVDNDSKEILLKINEFNTNGKKTIVYFIDSYYPIIDGVVSVMENYAKYMSDFYNVVVCAPKHKKETYVSDKYFVLGSNSVYLKKTNYDMGLPQIDDEFSKYIEMLKIDLIHINSPFTMGMYGLSIAKKRHIPSITTFHSQFKQDFYKATNSKLLAQVFTGIIINLYNKSTVTLTMNDFAAKIMKQYGLKRKKVQIVPNATSMEYKEFDKDYEKQVLEKYGYQKRKFNMLFIGRLVKVKNVYFILKVINELSKINKDFMFTFIGIGQEENKMKKYCEDNNLTNFVQFVGKITDEDEKAILIKNNDLLFFPSYYDTDGIVKIECACYSVPTLCLENTGVAAGLKNKINGFIEVDDLKLVVKRINWLSKNMSYVKRIGENAKEQVYITWNEVGSKLRNIYEKLLNMKNLKGAKTLK